nr:reverse transcriptase domain-containing protein [Tanacetum cinerariifolium]
MKTPVEKRNNNKFCEFHREVGHNTDECMHLRRKIEELIKNGKLARIIKELNQGSGKDQPKAAKKGETSRKDKPLAIMMVQPWQRVARQKITQSFFPSPKILFPPLRDEDGTKGPMTIEAEIGGHFIHRIYVDGGSASEILWPMRQILLPVLCDLLRRSLDVFVWKPTDMTGIPRYIAEHRLNVREGCSPVRQKKRSQAPERNKAIQEEVEKLVDADIMKEVHDHKLPTLTAPIEREKLIVYLTAAREAVSAVLMTKREAKQMPVYFVSRALPRTSVKGKILADFIVERLEDDPLDMPMEAKEELPDPWTLFTNGSSCVDGSGAGLILINSKGAKFTYTLRFRYPEVKTKKADAPNKIASTSFAHLTKQVLVEELNEMSINEAEVLVVTEEEGDTWMTPIYNYLMEETLFVKKEKARAVRRKSGRVLLANNAYGCKKFDTGMARLPEAVIPAEIGMPTMRTAKVDMVQNDKALEINLDLLEERKEQAAIREAKSKEKMEKYYNFKVRNTSFKPRDLVYRSNEASHAKESGKLIPK